MLPAILAMLFLGDLVYSDAANTDSLLTEAMEASCSTLGGEYHDGTTAAPDGTKYPKILIRIGGTGKEAVAAYTPLCKL